MWPKLSNINDKIYNKITNRNNYEVSQLNCWVRIFSGAGSGLIMVSNPNTKLFAAAGEGGIYGYAGGSENPAYSGTLGVDWSGKPVNPSAGRSLRPSPIVTSMEFEEGEDQISRSAKISITAFSLEQMEKIQQYFMEPGYSLFIEWGWNTIDGVGGLVKTTDSQGNVNAYGVPSSAASGNLKQGNINFKHTKTNGDYDSFLGFIVGGSVSNDGENFTVSVELKGTPELPTYLQNQNTVMFQPTEETVTKVDGSLSYPKADLTKPGASSDSKAAALDRRFKAMFNLLPATRQTKSVKDLKGSFQLSDFLNFDGLIEQNINSYLQAGFFKKISAWITGDSATAIEIENFEVEKEKLFSKNKYLRFGKAIEILNASGFESYVVGDKKVSVSVNIKGTKIGAFPLIFSTKPESLVIPGKLPNFDKYFLSTDDVNYSTVVNSPLDNSVMGVSFTGGGSSGDFIESAGYWGYLENLYINMDMFSNKLTVKNKNFREILLDILNEMSSAVNSFWDFQIGEDVDDNDNIVYTVYDRNWIGQKNATPKEFYHNGENSRFLDSSLTIDIPGEMANQIINRRLGLATQTDAPIVKVGSGTFFAKGSDKFMKGVNVRGKESTTDEAETPDPDTVAGKEKQLEDNKAGIEDITAGSTTSYQSYGQGPGITTVTDKNGNILKTISGYGSVTYGNNTEAKKLKELEDKNKELTESINDTKKSNLSSNVEKVEVVPKPVIVDELEITDDMISSAENGNTTFRENFRIFCFKDTNLLDYLKNLKILGSSGRLSHPLPIKYSFTIFGTSGIRRGDMFNIVGIPDKYRKNGLFQVNAVTHTIEGMTWKTQVEGLYRQVQ
jgi:hypothetical protein